MFCRSAAVKYLSGGFTTRRLQYLASRTMAKVMLDGVIAKLNEFAPESLCEKWDNVGLLVEPYTRRYISSILLTNDLTELVMGEAVSLNADLIISYHPPIFTPLKRITQKSWKERILSLCLQEGIAIYSPHTCWDNVTNGVNDWLAAALPLASSQPIQENLSNPSYGSGRICVVQGQLTLYDAIERIKKYTKIDTIQVARAHKTMHSQSDTQIRTFAVCAGSGASVLKGVKADLYITGEMSHHEVLDFTHQNIHVVLLGHSNSERGYLPIFQKILTSLLKDYKDVNVQVSKFDVDLLVSM
ncbi:NIF3-like protein 1 [Anopheles bellator]|uniref:NIF3-like protein 1 n=1 Tax=Anopheles bellator TaxID=139047 RepID=UPI002649073A|nr:NIF3-like protein 1 [Anopheles bellator]